MRNYLLILFAFAPASLYAQMFGGQLKSAKAGSITALNCASATNNGTLTQGTSASGVSSSVPYTGGNSGAHNGQTVTSTGVTGLTATLNAGTFANGAGNLTYTITGTPGASGTASFALNIGGQSCTLNLSVVTLASMYPAGSVFCSGPTAIVDVTDPLTGKTWMDRNLGATQVATSSTDANAYGDLYQWGRSSDGHQCRNSQITASLSGASIALNSNFICPQTDPFDWLTWQNNNLWQGISGPNNPCPIGYRVPTAAEISTEFSWLQITNAQSAFNSPLKLTKAGFRQVDGLLQVGAGSYWTGTIYTNNSGWNYSRNQGFTTTGLLGSNAERAMGHSVRCIKDVGTINILDCAAASNNGTLNAGNSANGISSVVSYTGGNGGAYFGQTVTSTGVTGLTASLAAGNFATGIGSLSYNITGMPNASGTASFVLNVGGQSCILNRFVNLPFGSITSLNCASAVDNGILTSNTVANGVSSVVPYSGGNGGIYSSQSTTSIGVTGLTAILSADTFSVGADSLTYMIIGTPSTNGTASFDLVIGGQSCTLNRNVNLLQGSIMFLNCASSANNGNLISGIATIGVSFDVPYTGGNGGSHNGQIVGSTGVTGLTATLVAGNFTNGTGILTYTITGTPIMDGTAIFTLNIGGQTCDINITVNSIGTYSTGSVFCTASSTIVVDVINPSTGKIWMDRNLGANQIANNSTDVNSYGDLYQWGRRSDGHQCRNSSTTTILSTSDQPIDGNFILTPSSVISDWRSPQNNNLWQGINGINNPCPYGYRLPTEIELNTERNSWINNNAVGAYASPIKFTMGGYRSKSTGLVSGVNTFGGYWSSTISNTQSNYLYLNINNASVNPYYRAGGLSVRCIKN